MQPEGEIVLEHKKQWTGVKIIKLILKIAVTGLCFWYISTKIDVTNAGYALLKAIWGFLLLAVLACMIYKFFAAFRLNINFSTIKLSLSEWKNIKIN